MRLVYAALLPKMMIFIEINFETNHGFLKLFLGVRARSLLERESSKSNSKRSNPTPIGPLVQDMIPTYQEKYDYVIFNRVPKVTISGMTSGNSLPVTHFRSNFQCNLLLVCEYVNDRIVVQIIW